MRAHFALSGALLASDASWMIYVEQDALLHGSGIIENEIAKSKLGVFLARAINLSQFNNPSTGFTEVES
jgi:hypothetical protein